MRKRVLIILSVAIIIILVLSLSYDKDDTPQPQATRGPDIVLPRVYVPLAINSCSYSLSKLGLAWGGRQYDVNADGRLCIRDGSYVSLWGPHTGTVGYRNLNIVPMLWGRTNSAGNIFEQWKLLTPITYAGWMNGPNECDRQDQCNLTIRQLAQLMLEASLHCPDCKWVTPSWSMAARCELLPSFIQEFKRIGGDVKIFKAIGLHLYVTIGATGLKAPPDTTDQMIDRCLHVMPTELVGLPVWVTEVGMYTCGQAPEHIIYDEFSIMLNDLEARPEVARYFVYSPYHLRSNSCDFMGLFDVNTDELTPAGLVIMR